MDTAAAAIPTTAGTAGGIYAGRFFVGTDAYALIVAPKAHGEIAEIAWHSKHKPVGGAASYSDGAANTRAMVKAGSELAKWAAGLRIGGFDDWYVPSRLELLIAFGELNALEAFQEDTPDGFAQEWYWSSTQYARDESYAWYQVFYYGDQSVNPKGLELRARAVRRLKI